MQVNKPGGSKKHQRDAPHLSDKFSCTSPIDIYYINIIWIVLRLQIELCACQNSRCFLRFRFYLFQGTKVKTKIILTVNRYSKPNWKPSLQQFNIRLWTFPQPFKKFLSALWFLRHLQLHFDPRPGLRSLCFIVYLKTIYTLSNWWCTTQRNEWKYSGPVPSSNNSGILLFYRTGLRRSHNQKTTYFMWRI